MRLALVTCFGLLATPAAQGGEWMARDLLCDEEQRCGGYEAANGYACETQGLKRVVAYEAFKELLYADKALIPVAFDCWTGAIFPFPITNNPIVVLCVPQTEVWVCATAAAYSA